MIISQTFLWECPVKYSIINLRDQNTRKLFPEFLFTRNKNKYQFLCRIQKKFISLAFFTGAVQKVSILSAVIQVLLYRYIRYIKTRTKTTHKLNTWSKVNFEFSIISCRGDQRHLVRALQTTGLEAMTSLLICHMWLSTPHGNQLINGTTMSVALI
jgi:hypothetical protein